LFNNRPRLVQKSRTLEKYRQEGTQEEVTVREEGQERDVCSQKIVVIICSRINRSPIPKEPDKSSYLQVLPMFEENTVLRAVQVPP